MVNDIVLVVFKNFKLLLRQQVLFLLEEACLVVN